MYLSTQSHKFSVGLVTVVVTVHEYCVGHSTQSVLCLTAATTRHAVNASPAAGRGVSARNSELCEEKEGI
jgi:hypothetical protein